MCNPWHLHTQFHCRMSHNLSLFATKLDKINIFKSNGASQDNNAIDGRHNAMRTMHSALGPQEPIQWYNFITISQNWWQINLRLWYPLKLMKKLLYVSVYRIACSRSLILMCTMFSKCMLADHCVPPWTVATTGIHLISKPSLEKS